MQSSKRKNEMHSAPRSAMRQMPPVSPARQARQEQFGMAEQTEKIPQTAAMPEKAQITANIARRKPLPRRATPNFSRLRERFTAGQTGGTAVLPAIKTPKVKIKKERERWSKFDFPFFTITIVLLAFGIVMMFSASYAYAFRMHGDSYFYAMRQLGFIIIGIIAMLVLSVTDYRLLLNKHIIKIGAAVSIGLMLLVRVIGTTQYGAERWLDFGGFTVQPSEILKFAVIIVFAYLLHDRYSRLHELKYGFLPLLIFLVISCGLTLLQPHLSGTIIIFLVGLIMMFVGDCKVKHIAIMVLVFLLLAAIGLGLLSAIGYDYFSDRILSWQNPEADIQNKTFQTYQSLVTIGSGGFFGLGLGNSRQKYAYLPASHNDFIFSIICEELGFVGAVLVILLFVLFVFRGFYIASRARDKFGMLLAVGITSQLGVQALLNIGVVTNSVPNTGISLPFFSYGGSALIMQLAEIGVLLNISRKAAIE